MKNADYPYNLHESDKALSSPKHPLDDKVLWNSIRNGNNLAFTTLYKIYVNQLFNYGMHISFDREAVFLKYFNELISSFMNGPEAFANFRRSGFPTLAENPFPGREGPFINRLTYPNSEISVNSENVQTAIAAQGADDLATKVWWDK